MPHTPLEKLAFLPALGKLEEAYSSQLSLILLKECSCPHLHSTYEEVSAFHNLDGKGGNSREPWPLWKWAQTHASGSQIHSLRNCPRPKCPHPSPPMILPFEGPPAEMLPPSLPLQPPQELPLSCLSHSSQVREFLSHDLDPKEPVFMVSNIPKS